MPRVRLFHWKAAEAKPRIDVLRAAGYAVDYDETFVSFRAARQSPPDAFVIDLTRMPSQGREVAVALRGSKATRAVPIVFVEGDPEKIPTIQRLLPDATYTTYAKVRGALKTAIAKPPSSPVVPTQMMDRFAHRSVVQKLGISKAARVAVIDAPADYAKALTGLPDGVTLIEDETNATDARIVLWFFHDPAGFQSALRRLRAVAARSRVWVLWRKNKRDGLDGSLVRRAILDIGLVDYKICSYDESWSAMVLAVKKAGR